MTSDISALMDGELDPEDAATLIGRMKQDPSLRQAWVSYHLLGDTLRGTGHTSPDFNGRFAHLLAQEPTVLAPARKQALKRSSPALSIAASISALSVVGLLAWQVVRLNVTPVGTSAVVATGASPAAPTKLASAAPVATQSKQAATQEPATIKFSSAADNSYLLAHQEFSPTYVVAGMPAYVRTVSGADQDSGQ
jgi:sigma-E factor negative regulatory protein RseA